MHTSRITLKYIFILGEPYAPPTESKSCSRAVLLPADADPPSDLRKGEECLRNVQNSKYLTSTITELKNIHVVECDVVDQSSTSLEMG